ncbi:hypothetical protein TorRG33x02_106890 [Trema orientale]|uniref:Uncharacterized protein n=1 Tax=Trema orientale TaxID=63057 RepID=A0A2P5F6J8_TREOI|nr:hypothetical protein TorRG33x02_106890 [Trema orientale]
MCARLVIGVMTLAGLRYLTPRSNTIRKELGSATTSDAISLGLDINNLQRNYLKWMQELLKTNWQRFWTVGCRRYGKIVRLRLHNLVGSMSSLVSLNIDSVTVSLDGQRAVVEATIEESSELTDFGPL